MTELISGFSDYSLMGIVFSWLAILTFILLIAIVHYRRLTVGAKRESFTKILEQAVGGVKKNSLQINKVEELVKLLQKESYFSIQKVGLVRFNPFSETGGNQSFSLALLDGNNDGLVISSFHSREGTRIYAKIVKKGEGKKSSFSNEEEEAILKAKK
ncbi:hypothetical protein COT63_02145 [Candidatus Shapirobacteria bacterium CG09_land_8_20_14_0_10_38_17]|uniref:DUF4446 domain-containing protein n=1 Tax=Candidatus Shapirobacteria bacterium CG09_land_8_20_14_0_10_38_17 TaxID=1974884 RepID=A0A2H0WQW8_9BACT|nr:MAG: hypothetical protein COT63_02145 [Candidatus Shapirobacteria bacterium CG09_land_8_20_14_0_10_38_17]